MSSIMEQIKPENPELFALEIGKIAETDFVTLEHLQILATRLGGSVVSVSDSWPGGCEFDPRLRRLFFLAYFRLSPLQKHVRKVVGGFERKVVLVLVWESQETHMCHRPPWYDLSC